ncbi:MAG: hypothetical protein IJ153_04630 [Clostridia bacterium]|nr:hypothetical protein [Clostridia bacterium]
MNAKQAMRRAQKIVQREAELAASEKRFQEKLKYAVSGDEPGLRKEIAVWLHYRDYLTEATGNVLIKSAACY